MAYLTLDNWQYRTVAVINDEKVSVVDKRFNDETARGDSEEFPTLSVVVKQLTEDKISAVTEGNGECYILKCIERKAGDYKKLDEARTSIESKMVEEKFNNLIDKKIKDGRIEIKERVYNGMKIR